MTKLTFDISMSLDGFIAGPNQTLEQPLGERGELLHQWAFAAGGGANVVQQYLTSGLLDELQIHLVPVLLGDGVRLFDNLGTGQVELECTRAIESPTVTHVRYRVVRAGGT